MKHLLKNLKKEDRTKEVLKGWKERKIAGPNRGGNFVGEANQNFQIAWTSTDTSTLATPRQI